MHGCCCRKPAHRRVDLTIKLLWQTFSPYNNRRYPPPPRFSGKFDHENYMQHVMAAVWLVVRLSKIRICFFPMTSIINPLKKSIKVTHWLCFPIQNGFFFVCLHPYLKMHSGTGAWKLPNASAAPIFWQKSILRVFRQNSRKIGQTFLDNGRNLIDGKVWHLGHNFLWFHFGFHSLFPFFDSLRGDESWG